MVMHIITISDVLAFINYHRQVREFVINIRPNYYMERVNGVVLCTRFNDSTMQLFIPRNELFKTEIYKRYARRAISEAEQEICSIQTLYRTFPARSRVRGLFNQR